MRVGYITQWFEPETGSASLPGVIARALQKRVTNVHVLTGFPNYPSGNLHPGYRIRPYAVETVDEITVHRAPLWPSHDDNQLHRVANYASFAAGSAAVGVTRFPSVDVNLVHSTPATVGATSLVMKAVRRTPYVLHIQDLWPDTVFSSEIWKNSKEGLSLKTLHAMCDRIYRSAHSIAVTSPGMRDKIANRGISPDKIHVVGNWADEAAFRPVPAESSTRAALGITSKFTVMYAGNFGEHQALDTLIKAAEILRSRSDVGFVLVGSGMDEPRLRRMARGMKLHNVTFSGPRPFEQMADVLSVGDLHYIGLRNRPVFESTTPSKVPATMAAGRPVVCAVKGDASDLVNLSGSGISVPPDSPEQLAAAIASAADMAPEELGALGAAGRRYYQEWLSEEASCFKLVHLLSDAHKDRDRRMS